MAKYKLTNKAVEDLTKIWNYTFDTWSEKQADLYYESLLFGCQKVANDLSIGKNYTEVIDNLFGYKVNKHIIFYRETGLEYIEITRILHEQMDLVNRLLD